MKTTGILLLLLALACISTTGYSQTKGETGPASAVRRLGELNWSMELGPITGGVLHLGAEFDGTNFWVSGTHDFTAAHLFEIAPNGTLVNSYSYPGVTGFGFRDLAFDGQYLYAGEDVQHPGYIVQIDPADGQPTGVRYGPYPLPICRALAYQTSDDSFWAASFSSSFYHCYKDGTYVELMNPGLAIYALAIEEENVNQPILWIWTQDSSGDLAIEYDIVASALTGRTFVNPYPGGGVITGSSAYSIGGRDWEMAALNQSSPDTLIGIDLETNTDSLVTYDDRIYAYDGGTVTFYLHAGAANAGRLFGLFGTTSGTAPGTTLPGGLAVLPINWDWYTDLLTGLALAAHPFVPLLGTLDGDGEAEVTLTFPRFTLYEIVDSWYAYCLASPFDFASNAVEVKLMGLPIGQYAYDDGLPDNSILLTGHAVRLHGFDAGPGDVIYSVSSTFGVEGGTKGPPNGTPCTVYVWDDPTNDGDPHDAVLLGSKAGVVQSTNTNIFIHYSFDSPIAVTGEFFVGCHVDAGTEQYEFGLDQSFPYIPGIAWLCGGQAWDPNDLTVGGCYEMGSIGYPAYWMLRANAAK